MNHRRVWFGVIVIFATVFGYSVATATPGENARFPGHYRSKYFVFEYERPDWEAAEFAHFADGLIELVTRDFFTANFDYPIHAVVLRDKESFQHYLRSDLQISRPPDFGMYFRRSKTFVTYEESGFGTFAHEIMHPLVEHNLPGCTGWAVEGVPTFFEKFYAYWDGPVLKAYWGYQNPWRLKALGDRLVQLDLAAIINGPIDPEKYEESEQRLVSMFLWKQGKFRRFLKLMADGSSLGYKTYFEAAMQMPLQKIAPLWKAYLEDIRLNRIELMMSPPSQVFKNRAEARRFMELNHLPETVTQ